MATETPVRPSRLVAFRNAFLSGALLLAPLIVTVWAFGKVVEIVGGSVRPVYESFLPDSISRNVFFWDLIGTIVVILLVTAFGYLSSYVFGKFFLSVAEGAIQRIPGFGVVYNSVKQIVGTFGSQNRNTFSKVVLLEYPRKGCWTLGFLTSKEQGEAQSAVGADTWTVFVPTTPNPTAGFLLMLPRTEVIELEMSVGDGMKMILSGGAMVPPHPASSAPRSNHA